METTNKREYSIDTVKHQNITEEENKNFNEQLIAILG